MLTPKQEYTDRRVKLLGRSSEGEKMLIYFLIIVMCVQLIRHLGRQRVTLNGVIHYLMPYWKEGDREDRIIGVLQLLIVACISLLMATHVEAILQKVIVFLLTFMSLVWFMKIALCIIEWLQDYIHTMTVNIIFTLVVPIMILINLQQIDAYIEIQICLCALLMSVLIVYMELINIVLGQGEYQKATKYLVSNSGRKLKSILTWLMIILVNLYTLVLFIQFYIETSAYHFIQTKVLNKASAVDLFYYLIVTFTTVGFGDISPHTLLAKMVSALVALSGMVFTGVFVGCILNLKE